jgi:hypothetical protein
MSITESHVAKWDDPHGDGCPARGETAAGANASVIQRDMS